MRTKVSLLVCIAGVGGTLIGTFAAQYPGQVWPILVGLAVLLPILIVWGQAWVTGPYEKLMHWIEVQARSAAPFALKHLPTERQDEVGRIARSFHTIGATAIRNRHDAQQLRRTLDARVKNATQRACSQLEQQAMRDHLTGLGNRRVLDKQVQPLVEAARKSHTEMLCVMIDMDDFKQINDTLGHAMGDEILQLLANLIKAGIRSEDLAVRQGGDEFSLLMPGSTLDRAIDFAQQTRTLFCQQTRITLGPDAQQPNLSVGIASMTLDDCQTGAELMSKADEYLYAAKHAGKGCTRSARTPSSG